VPQFIVLLRGVNVGKGNRVPMADFKAMLEAMGYSDVKTLLNSGNARIRSSQRNANQHADAIAQQVAAKFGVTTPVIVKSAQELSRAIVDCPWPPEAGEASRFLVCFGRDAQALQALQPIAEIISAQNLPDKFAVCAAAAYLACPDGLLKSSAANALLGKSGRSVTTRNWATTLKLQALCTSKKEN
jgi:uncharacterized protein (DUF1697 family)